MTASSQDLQGSPDEKWDPAWSNAVFSLAERDRRWARVRALMKRDGIDLLVCMPCTNSHDRGAADARYLTQLGENSDESSVAFPIEGEVRAWHSRPGVWPSSNWFADIRLAGRGTGGATISSYINEFPQYAKSRIAIAGPYLDADDALPRGRRGDQLAVGRNPQAQFPASRIRQRIDGARRSALGEER